VALLPVREVAAGLAPVRLSSLRAAATLLRAMTIPLASSLNQLVAVVVKAEMVAV
jgi:hypothetical protein